MFRFPIRIAGLLAALSIPPVTAHSDQTNPEAKQTPQDLVNALHAAFGTHRSLAVHAKGTILSGTFIATTEAKKLSASPIFSGAKVPITARFSDFTDIPTLSDAIPEPNPCGFAVKFHTKGGAVDVVTHSFNGFPVAMSDQLALFLHDIGASGPGTTHPMPMKEFLSSRPIAKTFIDTRKTQPMSYATSPYFGVGTFRLVNSAGRSAFVRYRFVPLAGEQFLTPAELEGRGPNYQQEEVPYRIKQGPIEFEWFAQISGKAEKIDDLSVAWPEERRLVKLGTISMTALVADEAEADRKTLFRPGREHVGIEPVDPMLRLRNKSN